MTLSPPVRAVVFDAYGTLLDAHSAVQRHAARLGDRAAAFSRDWRAKHLEYTWVLTIAQEHRDFWALLRAALDHTAALHGVTDRALLDDLLAAYRTLDPYPEVPDTLRRLRALGLPLAILSNGTPKMLREAAAAAGIAGLLDDLLSVEAVGVYKPDPRVYALATARFACAPAEIAFLSSNPWDAYGAQRFGCRVFRVNRGHQPDEYGLRASAADLPDLASLPDRLR
jgi:2-haloacid dehalogenase